MSVIAPVTNISRCSLHDGPGIRTVVYFKGCSLKCEWCHNPETQAFKKQILYAASKCIHCGKCIEICPEHHVIEGNDMHFLREGCSACGRCADACPSLALSMCGEGKTADELVDELKKDQHYYTLSGGGVTFSGGECLMYPEFVAEVAKKCRENAIHTAIESAFHVPWENVEAVLPVIDLFFADLKIPDPEKHRRFTGKDNVQIIENIRKLSERAENIILRIPVIPGVNDSAEDIDGFADIIKTFGKGITGVELLKYNNLAEAKYAIAGMEYTKFADNAQADEEMEKLRAALAEKSGRNCFFV